MRKYLLSFATAALLISLIACSKTEQAGTEDSLLVTTSNEPYDTARPATETEAPPMDSLKAHQERDEAKLQRFQPVDVVKIYADYRALRNPNTTRAQVNAFLAAHKMTLDELHAVLSEGDRLGWGK